MLSYTVIAYVVYLLISIGVTVWVARTLHSNGRRFLVDAFDGDESLADSVNHLLVVGFYLVNIGYVALALKYGDKPETLQTTFEFCSTKIGIVLLALGVMHFLNLFVLSKLRGRRSTWTEFPPDEPSDPMARMADGTPIHSS